MSSLTTNISLILLAHGESPDAWDVEANANFTLIDELFSGTRSDDSGTGHIHDGTNGQGPKIKHLDLLHYDSLAAEYTPTYEHEDIDNHIDDVDETHFTIPSIRFSITDNDYANTGASVTFPDAGWTNGPYSEKLITEIRFPNAVSITSPSAGVVVVDTGTIPTSGTGPGNGVPTHLPSSTAPVAVTDLFTADDLTPLSKLNWWVDKSSLEFLIYQDSARLSINTTSGSPAIGTIVNRVKAQVPHSEVQRVTANLCRVGTDDFVSGTDSFTFQLSLMSSSFRGQNTISRLGFFLKIDVFKQSATLYMTRTIYAVPSVNTTGYGTAVTLWTDTGPVSDYRHFQGTHEFSLDRTHAFHYYYNNGPVNIGTAGQSNAASPFIQTLISQLLTEFSLYPQTSGPLGVAPQYGRFGFDAEWMVAAGGTLDASVEYFTATGLDDEVIYYSAVKKGGDCGFVLPPQIDPDEPCCPGGSEFPTITPGTIIPDLPPVGGEPANGNGGGAAGGGGVESGGNTSGEATNNGGGDYRVMDAIAAGDPFYTWQGFLVKPVGYELDPTVAPIPIFCTAMDNLVVTTEQPPRAFTKGAKLIISGDRIPGLLMPLVFKPSDPTVALPTPVPPGSGAFLQALPYPVPAQPGALDLITAGATAGVWDMALELDDRVFQNVSWYRDPVTADLVITFDVADGIPVGFSADLTVTSGADIANSVTLDNAVIIRPGQPEWTESRFYQKETDGTFSEVTEISDATDLYIVAAGKKLPLPFIKSADASDAATLWNGFPVDIDYDYDGDTISDLFGRKYFLVDTDTGELIDLATVSGSGLIYKGRHNEAPTLEFPPTNVTPDDISGETLFMKISVPAGYADRNLALRVKEIDDPSLAIADLNFPPIIAVTPTVRSVTVNSTTPSGTARTFTVTGTGFSSVTVSTTTPSCSFNAISSQSATQVIFTGTVTVSTTAVYRLTNSSGQYVEISVIFGSANVPEISSVTPVAVTAGIPNIAFVVAGNLFDEGAALSASPLTNIRDVVLDAGADTISFIADVPSLAGSDISFVVTNPNGSASNTETLTISAPTAPALTTFAYYATEADYVSVTANTLGKEVGQSGILKITGTNFVQGMTISSDSPADFVVKGITIVNSTTIKVDYEIAESATVGAIVTITCTHPDNVTTGTKTLTIERHTPIITVMNVTNKREGAGNVAAPTNSAVVLISGSYFFLDGVDDIDDVTVQTANGSVPAWTTVNDNLIRLDRLVIDDDTVGDTFTIRVTTVSGKYAEKSFTIEQHLIPRVVSWVVLPTMGGDPLDPIEVTEGATGHIIEIYGTGLLTDGASITGPYTGTPVFTSSDTVLSITLPTVDTGITGDPTIRLVLTPFGTTTQYTTDLFQIDTAGPGTPTVTDVTAFSLIEGSRAASLEITGTNLSANAVGSVEVYSTDTDMLPVAMQPIGARLPIKATISSQTSTRIVAKLELADNLYNVPFRLRLNGPDGASLSIGTHDLTIEAFPLRARFDTPYPTLDSSIGAANDAVYDIIDPVGGEYIEIYNTDDEDLSVTPVPTILGPLQLEVTFNMPSVAGKEVEIRLKSAKGQVLSVHRTTTVT